MMKRFQFVKCYYLRMKVLMMVVMMEEVVVVVVVLDILMKSDVECHVVVAAVYSSFHYRLAKQICIKKKMKIYLNRYEIIFQEENYKRRKKLKNSNLENGIKHTEYILKIGTLFDFDYLNRNRMNR